MDLPLYLSFNLHGGPLNDCVLDIARGRAGLLRCIMHSSSISLTCQFRIQDMMKMKIVFSFYNWFRLHYFNLYFSSSTLKLTWMKYVQWNHINDRLLANSRTLIVLQRSIHQKPCSPCFNRSLCHKSRVLSGCSGSYFGSSNAYVQCLQIPQADARWTSCSHEWWNSGLLLHLSPAAHVEHDQQLHFCAIHETPGAFSTSTSWLWLLEEIHITNDPERSSRWTWSRSKLQPFTWSITLTQFFAQQRIVY